MPILGMIASSVKAAINSFLAVSHSDSPYLTIFPWNNGFGTKLSNPATLPSGGNGISFSPEGDTFVITEGNSPYVSAYPFSSSGFGTKYSNPATLPTNANDVSFSPSGTTLAFSQDTTPFVSAYPWNPGFGTKYSNPATIPPDVALSVDFSINNDVAFGHRGVFGYGSPPYISVYPFSNGFGTRYAQPSPHAGTGYSVAWSSTANKIAIGGPPYYNPVKVYPWNSGFGTKYADPATGPHGSGYGYSVKFSPDDNHIAFGNGGRINVYNWNNGFGTRLAQPASTPSNPEYQGGVRGVSWSANTDNIAFAYTPSSGGGIFVYPWNNGFGTRYSNPSPLGFSGSNKVKFYP